MCFREAEGAEGRRDDKALGAFGGPHESPGRSQSETAVDGVVVVCAVGECGDHFSTERVRDLCCDKISE
jgi:hypothetical protein